MPATGWRPQRRHGAGIDAEDSVVHRGIGASMLFCRADAPSAAGAVVVIHRLAAFA